MLCTEPDRVPHVAGDVPGTGHAVQGQDADAAWEVPRQAGPLPRRGTQGPDSLEGWVGTSQEGLDLAGVMDTVVFTLLSCIL